MRPKRSLHGDKSSNRSGCWWYALGFGHGGVDLTIQRPVRSIWSCPTSRIIWRDPENGPSGSMILDAHSLTAGKSVELRLFWQWRVCRLTLSGCIKNENFLKRYNIQFPSDFKANFKFNSNFLFIRAQNLRIWCSRSFLGIIKNFIKIFGGNKRYNSQLLIILKI